MGKPLSKLWEKHPSGDKGVYTDYLLRFDGLTALVEEMNAPHAGYGGGGRCYAKDKPPVSQWNAKVGQFAIPRSSQNWDYPTAEEAMRACEAALLGIANKISAALK